MNTKYIYETEYEIPDYCHWIEDLPDCWRYHSCPFFFYCGMNGRTALNCECALVPFTGKERTNKFKVASGEKWERCPISRL